MLSNVLPRQPQGVTSLTTVTKPNQLPSTKTLVSQHFQDQNGNLGNCAAYGSPSSLNDNEVLIVNQPYRTTPLVLPHAKTIHDIGNPKNKFISPTKEPQPGQPYRTSSMAMPAPKTINEAGAGAPAYQQHRGPQYFTDRTPVPKGPTVYNSPAALYSQETLAEEADNPSYSQANTAILQTPREPSVTKGQESATHKMVMESEMASGQALSLNTDDCSSLDRPDSQMSNKSDRWRPGMDPLLKNSSINQSASFKKVMYSVMGDSSF